MGVPASRLAAAAAAAAAAALLSTSASGQPAPRQVHVSPERRLVVFEMLTRPT